MSEWNPPQDISNQNFPHPFSFLTPSMSLNLNFNNLNAFLQLGPNMTNSSIFCLNPVTVKPIQSTHSVDIGLVPRKSDKKYEYFPEINNQPPLNSQIISTPIISTWSPNSSVLTNSPYNRKQTLTPPNSPLKKLKIGKDNSCVVQVPQECHPNDQSLGPASLLTLENVVQPRYRRFLHIKKATRLGNALDNNVGVVNSDVSNVKLVYCFEDFLTVADVADLKHAPPSS